VIVQGNDVVIVGLRDRSNTQTCLLDDLLNTAVTGHPIVAKGDLR